MCLGRFGNFRKLGTMDVTLSETMYEDVQGVSTLGHLRDLRDLMTYRLGPSTGTGNRLDCVPPGAAI